MTTKALITKLRRVYVDATTRDLAPEQLRHPRSCAAGNLHSASETRWIMFNIPSTKKLRLESLVYFYLSLRNAASSRAKFSPLPR